MRFHNTYSYDVSLNILHLAVVQQYVTSKVTSNNYSITNYRRI